LLLLSRLLHFLLLLAGLLLRLLPFFLLLLFLFACKRRRILQLLLADRDDRNAFFHVDAFHRVPRDADLLPANTQTTTDTYNDTHKLMLLVHYEIVHRTDLLCLLAGAVLDRYAHNGGSEHLR